MAARKKANEIDARIEALARELHALVNDAREQAKAECLLSVHALIDNAVVGTRVATKIAKPRRAKATKKAKPTRVMGKRIASLGLRESTTAKLLGVGLTTVNKVVIFHRDEPKGLRSIYRFGATSVDEVREAFAALKVRLDTAE